MWKLPRQVGSGVTSQKNRVIDTTLIKSHESIHLWCCISLLPTKKREYHEKDKVAERYRERQRKRDGDRESGRDEEVKNDENRKIIQQANIA